MENLTQGNITKQLLRLALPLIMASLLQQLYNTVDALIVGRFVGSAAFAAVGVAGTVMNLFIFIISGGCTGVGIIWAQLYGRGDWRQFRQESFVAFAVGSGAALLMSCAGLLFLKILLRLIATPPEILPLAAAYLQIIFCGLLPVFFYNYYSTLLRSVGNTAMALCFLGAALLLNVLLDLLLVAQFNLGIAGAAYATVLAQIFAVACCWLYLRCRWPQLLWNAHDMRFDRALVKRTCNYALVTAMHNSNLYIGKLLVQGAVNGCGVDMVAAYTAAGRLEGFVNSFGDSGTAALNVFVAQNYGAGKFLRIKQGFRRALFLLLGFGAFCSALLYFGAPQGVGFLLGSYSGGSWRYGVEYMQIIALFYCLCLTGNVLAGYFEGCGRLMVPTLGATGHISLRVLLSYLFVQEYGLASVAYATGFGWLCVVTFWSWLARKDLQKNTAQFAARQ